MNNETSSKKVTAKSDKKEDSDLRSELIISIREFESSFDEESADQVVFTRSTSTSCSTS